MMGFLRKGACARCSSEPWPCVLYLTVFPPWFPPMVCCKNQSSCPEFISFSGATILIGLPYPVLSFPVLWISAFNIPFLQLSPSGVSFTLNHEGETQIHLTCSWLTPLSLAVAGVGQGLSTVTLQPKNLAMDDVALL